jgi:hypothetical protein
MVFIRPLILNNQVWWSRKLRLFYILKKDFTEQDCSDLISTEEDYLYKLKMIVMKLNKLLAILVVFAIGMTGAYAQLPDQLPEAQPTEVSENELEQFAQAFREIQVIDHQVQMEMLNTVQEEGIDVDRFNEFLSAQQDPAQQFDASEEELSRFATAYQEIGEIQEQALQQMQKVITENELSLERYQEIAMTIQANPELLQKLQEHFEE